MKNSAILICFFFVAAVFAQPSGQAGTVSYTENFGPNDHAQYTLYFCKQESVYEKIFLPQTGPTYSIMGFVEPKIKSVYHTDLNSRQITFLEGIAFKPVTAREPIAIQWKIEADTAKIGGFKCQKATTNFKGNAYTAWFTSEIPAAFGPWKFNGLPGLILQCQDDTGFFKVTATKVNFDAECEIVAAKIKSAAFEKPISMERYVELKRNENDEIFNFYQSISPRDSFLSVETDLTGFMREPLK